MWTKGATSGPALHRNASVARLDEELLRFNIIIIIILFRIIVIAVVPSELALASARKLRPAPAQL